MRHKPVLNDDEIERLLKEIPGSTLERIHMQNWSLTTSVLKSLLTYIGAEIRSHYSCNYRPKQQKGCGRYK